MMYSTNVQLVKWTFPAVAFIFGLFWYKRRRIDRADPGGTAESDSPNEMQAMKEINSNIYDSTNKETDESFSTSSCKRQEVPARAPRKVSESMDIPIRKSVQQPCDSSQICTEVESTTDIQLGSNPTTSYFETIAKRRNTPSFELADDVTKRIFREDVAEVPYDVQYETSEQNATAELDRETDKQLAEEHPEDTAAGQAVYERDSANHSPFSGLLEGSIIDEAGSEEGSTDSGKGGSINGYRKTNVGRNTYYFAIPQQLVGRLIGRYGSFVHSIRTKMNVEIYINDHPGASDQKICSIEGDAEGINGALDMIRKKFPEKKFPEVTLIELARAEVMNVEPPWVAQCMQMSLVEGVNNDILVSHLVKPNWLFVQMPTHPTYPSLRILEMEMTNTYNSLDWSIPHVLEKGMIYAANWYNVWIRVTMEKPDLLGERHTMRLLDHGGYISFHTSQLRDIKPEFLGLPFQAVEIYLAHILPKDGVWAEEAYSVIADMCFGIVGQAQVEAYINSNVYTNIYYRIPRVGIISLADELVARGFAVPASLHEMAPLLPSDGLYDDSVYDPLLTYKS